MKGNTIILKSYKISIFTLMNTVSTISIIYVEDINVLKIL
jgi:hypothetical protein